MNLFSMSAIARTASEAIALRGPRKATRRVRAAAQGAAEKVTAAHLTAAHLTAAHLTAEPLQAGPLTAEPGTAAQVTAGARSGQALAELAPAAHEFDQLVRDHQDRVYRLALRLTGSKERAWDAAQETFCRAFHHLPSVRERDRVGSWLARIVVNACLNERRRFARRGHSSLDAMADRDAAMPDRAATPPEELARKEREQEVRDAVCALPPELRGVVVLRDMEGLSYEEVAHILCLPIGTVRSRLHRARGVLRRDLAEVLAV